MKRGFRPLLALLLLSALCMTPVLHASALDGKAEAIAVASIAAPVMIADFDCADIDVTVCGISPPASFLRTDALYCNNLAAIKFEPERPRRYGFSWKDNYKVACFSHLPVTFASLFRPPRC